MPEPAKHIFLSYAHEDEQWKNLVLDALKAHGEMPEDQLGVWVDTDSIRAGDDWNKRIKQALDDASIALLLLTTKFLTSQYIRDVELSRLIERRKEEGLTVIPIPIFDCPWSSWPSLKEGQMRPDPKRPLGEMTEGERARVLTDLAKEIAKTLKEKGISSLLTDVEPAHLARVRLLLRRTLCAGLGKPHDSEAARQLAEHLRNQTELKDNELFQAARLLVEDRLLGPDPVHCQLGPDGKFFFPGGWDAAEKMLDAIRKRQGISPADLTRRIKPEQFLKNSLERAEDWFGYFSALASAGPMAAGDVQTLVEIDVQGGAIAPQFLLAGLMSHFHEEWKPVITAYKRHKNSRSSTSDEGTRTLERLRASQWICWLVWGPSIPLCTCTHWRPRLAYQYGYGDENNSMPVYFDESTPRAAELLSLLRSHEHGERRAVQARITGRLTCGSFAFARPGDFAPAQSRITTGTANESDDDRKDVRPSDGLILKVREVRPSMDAPSDPAYFTAYIWLMFWIARSSSEEDSRLVRLNGRSLPKPPAAAEGRDRIRDESLYEDLLPVFVHANIIDPVALRFQKGMLVEIALHVLRQMWEASEAAPGGGGQDAGIQFYLVCASDYAGCGCDVLQPPAQGSALADLLRVRLAEEAEHNAAFARSVHLPDAQEPGGNPLPEFRELFSACHLPEMIYDYYRQVQKVLDELNFEL